MPSCVAVRLRPARDIRRWARLIVRAIVLLGLGGIVGSVVLRGVRRRRRSIVRILALVTVAVGISLAQSILDLSPDILLPTAHVPGTLGHRLELAPPDILGGRPRHVLDEVLQSRVREHALGVRVKRRAVGHHRAKGRDEQHFECGRGNSLSETHTVVAGVAPQHGKQSLRRSITGDISGLAGLVPEPCSAEAGGKGESNSAVVEGACGVRREGVHFLLCRGAVGQEPDILNAIGDCPSNIALPVPTAQEPQVQGHWVGLHDQLRLDLDGKVSR